MSSVLDKLMNNKLPKGYFMKCSSMTICNAFGPKLELQVPDLFAPIWSGFSYIDEGRRSTLSTTHATLASYFDSD